MSEKRMVSDNKILSCLVLRQWWWWYINILTTAESAELVQYCDIFGPAGRVWYVTLKLIRDIFTTSLLQPIIYWDKKYDDFDCRGNQSQALIWGSGHFVENPKLKEHWVEQPQYWLPQCGEDNNVLLLHPYYWHGPYSVAQWWICLFSPNTEVKRDVTKGETRCSGVCSANWARGFD